MEKCFMHIIPFSPIRERLQGSVELGVAPCCVVSTYPLKKKKKKQSLHAARWTPGSLYRSAKRDRTFF